MSLSIMETNSFKIRKFSGLNQDWFAWKSDFLNSMWILDLGEVLETPNSELFNPTQDGGNLYSLLAGQQPIVVGAKNQIFPSSTDSVHHENIKFRGATPPGSRETLETSLPESELELRGEIKDAAPTTKGASTVKTSEQSDKASPSSDKQEIILEMEEQTEPISEYQKRFKTPSYNKMNKS